MRRTPTLVAEEPCGVWSSEREDDVTGKRDGKMKKKKEKKDGKRDGSIYGSSSEGSRF